MTIDFEYTLEQLYSERYILEDTGDRHKYRHHLNDASHDPEWFGLTIKQIEENKWKYPHPIEKASFPDLFQLGKTCWKKKYSEDDGYDMHMDRYLEGLPGLIDRFRKEDKNLGKFVKIWFNVGENCHITSEAMLNKAMFAVSLLDYLESIGKRVQLSVVARALHPGEYKKQLIHFLTSRCMVKDFGQPVILPTIATALSTWMLRWWILGLMSAKIIPYCGYGQSINLSKDEIPDDVIYIGSGMLHNKDEREEFVKNMINKTET
jgi:hypothetical protein